MPGQMGGRNVRSGLQDRIFGNTKVQGGVVISGSPRRIKKCNLVKRGRRYVTQISYSSSERESPRGILFKNFPSTQERGEMEASHKSQTSKSVYQKAEIQNGNPAEYHTGCKCGRLASVNRSQGRLLSRTNPSKSLEVPSVCGRQRQVRVHGAAVRYNDGPKSVYQDDGAGGGIHQEGDGVVQFTLPRRFLDEGQRKIVFSVEVSGSDQLHARHRVGYQLGKVGNSTVSRSGSCRGQVQNVSRNGDAPRGKSVESDKFGRNNTESTSGFSKGLLENVGSPQQLYISGRLGETVSETDPVISTSDVETEYGRSEGHDTNKAGTGGAFELVEVSRKSSVRLTPEAIRSSTHPGDRCQYDGLGGVPRGRGRNQGDMVRGGGPETHKLAGDEGSLQQPDLFQESVVQENHDSDQVRQQNSGGISQQTGRNEVDLVVLSDVGSAKLVQGKADSSESSLHQGSGKCPGRSSFQEGRSSRVVPLSRGGSESVPDLGEASGGSVCKRVEQQAGHILLEGERSGGLQDRRIESGLERPGNVCVSSRTPDPKSDSESEIQHNKNDTSGFEQESKTVDVSARRATIGHSKSSASKGKVAKDAKLKSVPSGSRKPAFSCLDDRRRKLRQKGFRRGAAEMATGDIRKSTASCYSARVQAYVRWCNENGVKNPVGSSVASVCNYLYGLYEKGKAARTIGGYISAISKWHDKVHGKSLCEVPEVASFRKASVINRPPSQVNFNSWSLPLVLQRLTREPFEPLEGVPLKFLTWKTVFLVACTTARRCSEIGALSTEKDKLIVRPHGIEIGYVPGFIPKNARVNYAGRTVVIPRFDDMASCEEERSLCPRRAVNVYRKRSELYRKTEEKRLFVTYGAGESQGKGASKKTLARWIVQTIQFAYTESNTEERRVSRIKAHSVRSAATTYALLKGVNIEHILQAADWASPTTFINHYFRPGEGPGQSFAASILRKESQ